MKYALKQLLTLVTKSVSTKENVWKTDKLTLKAPFLLLCTTKGIMKCVVSMCYWRGYFPLDTHIYIENIVAFYSHWM